MEYAPVVIPTLCRYDHFKECMESLMQCAGADKTDVYVGLDYPASPAHEPGWMCISTWLDSIEKTHPFKSLHVIRRDHNYGIGKDGNFRSLMRDVFKNYDRLIFSEDDNVFSPAFLEYINVGLERFRDDHSVFAINGYRHFYDVRFGENTIFRQNVDFSAWGYGIWRDRFEKAEESWQTSYWRKKAMNPLNWHRISKNGLNRLMSFIGMVKDTKVVYDNGQSVYMGINGLDVVMPRVSLVRNMGWDGSGENCRDGNPGLSEKITSQSLYESDKFIFTGSGKEYYKYNHSIYVRQSYARMTILEFVTSMFGKIFRRRR